MNRLFLIVQAAQTIAMREDHQRFLPEHLLKALLDDDQGMSANLIKQSGGDPGVAAVYSEMVTNTVSCKNDFD